MEKIEPLGTGVYKAYQKTIKRKLSNGTMKNYNTVQNTVNINFIIGEFTDGMKVAVIPSERLDELARESVRCKNQINEFNMVQELYSKCQETNNQLADDIKKLRNDNDHLQENFTKSLNEINSLRKEFLDYVLAKEK